MQQIKTIQAAITVKFSNGYQIFFMYFGAGDCAKTGELFAQTLVVNGVVQILDIQIDAHVAVVALLLLLLVDLFQVAGALELLLEATHK